MSILKKQTQFSALVIENVQIDLNKRKRVSATLSINTFLLDLWYYNWPINSGSQVIIERINENLIPSEVYTHFLNPSVDGLNKCLLNLTKYQKKTTSVTLEKTAVVELIKLLIFPPVPP